MKGWKNSRCYGIHGFLSDNTKNHWWIQRGRKGKGEGGGTAVAIPNLFQFKKKHENVRKNSKIKRKGEKKKSFFFKSCVYSWTSIYLRVTWLNIHFYSKTFISFDETMQLRKKRILILGSVVIDHFLWLNAIINKRYMYINYESKFGEFYYLHYNIPSMEHR